jgi:hypothetical protein
MPGRVDRLAAARAVFACLRPPSPAGRIDPRAGCRALVARTHPAPVVRQALVSCRHSAPDDAQSHGLPASTGIRLDGDDPAAATAPMPRPTERPHWPAATGENGTGRANASATRIDTQRAFAMRGIASRELKRSWVSGSLVAHALNALMYSATCSRVSRRRSG